jgi:uncharacterized protein (DUF924 family)
MRNQFSRNVYRDTHRAFAQDALALALAQELVASGQDRSLPLAQRSFAYMPYMHSESALVHAQAVVLFSGCLPFREVYAPTATPSWAASPRPRSWRF